MSEPGPETPPSEEEIRELYEQQIKQVRVDQLVLENVVTVLNLGMRRTGLAPGTEDERDVGQVRLAIESVRAQLSLLEESAPQQVAQIRDALSQLQMAFVRLGGQSPPAAARPPEDQSPGAQPTAPESKQPNPEEPGPAQRSGRLWVPGQ